MERKTKVEESFVEIDREDMKNINNIYYSKEVYKTLHLTRDAVRYYEKLGLIKPSKKEENQYRMFTAHDLEKLLWVDFYKKRGFHAAEIKTLFTFDEVSELDKNYSKQCEKMENEISVLEKRLRQLKEDWQFLKSIEQDLNAFSIKDFPLHEVVDSISSVTAIFEARGNAFSFLNWDEENYMTNMIRCVTFEDSGYKSSVICYTKEAKAREKQKKYLESGKCIYTVVESEINDTETMGRMYELCISWIQKQNLRTKGIVYIRPRILIMGQRPRCYFETWIPVK